MGIQLFARRVAVRCELECVHRLGAAVAAFRGNGVSAYWYRDVLNFGDILTPLLLRHFGHSPIFDRPERARLVATGSILEHVPGNYSGIILGSGFLYENTEQRFPDALVLAVRGELTRSRLGIGRKAVTLGDPGLLADEVLEQREAKRFALGIIPHYSEFQSPVFAQLMTRLGSAATLINVQDQPLPVFAKIDQCENILSSSLHGLIVADSLGIPNRWLASPNLLGGRFKFDDYYSGIGVRAEPFILSGWENLTQLLALVSLRPVERIREIKAGLHGLWKSLPRLK